jgi:predicted nucleotidyltransferase
MDNWIEDGITGLEPGDIKKIRKVFSAFKEIDIAKIYGSRAKGTFRPASDIDVCLFGEHLNLTILHEIEFQIDDLLLPFKFDLSIYHQISNPDFKDHINRVGKIFYKKDIS